MNRPNPLLDPTRQPDGYIALHCGTCERWVAWCSPPAPPVPVTCRDCAAARRGESSCAACDRWVECWTPAHLSLPILCGDCADVVATELEEITVIQTAEGYRQWQGCPGRLSDWECDPDPGGCGLGDGAGCKYARTEDTPW